jgi:uncharacterized protein (DUF2235 family)
MARIAIFCDGTWNSPTMKQPTHVVRLFNKTIKSNAQQAHYFEGVGVDTKDPGIVRRTIMKVGGGAFGWGLNDHIKAAYKALVQQYQPDDEIFVFGFSRGAYTARSLVGMIRKCGMIEDATDANVDAAFELYRKPGVANHPDALHILQERRRLSPRTATSRDDINWRKVHPWEGHPTEFHKVTIRYLGVWDTVGSLGVPAPILGNIANFLNRKYHFHNTSLTSMVQAARHAVALDERRVLYQPTLWDNLEATRDHPGLNKGDRSEERPYQQIWFIGTHAIVGGSEAKARALTGDPLDWIARGAKDAGLDIDMSNLLDRAPDPLVDSFALSNPPWLYKVVGHMLKWRAGPGHPIDLAPSADIRVKKRRDYRPRSLKNLMPELFGAEPLPKPVRVNDGPQR